MTPPVTRLGALVLGYGFLWSDLACYTAGVLGAAAIERASRAPATSGSQSC